ncbi:MAG: cohesin domain-containing protein [Sulfuricaulis sp.]
MKRTIYSVVCSMLLLLVSGTSQAATVGFDPIAQTVSTGSSLSVKLGISALGDGVAPSLSTFDLNIGYDPSLLSFTGVIFGDPVLGDQLDLFSLGSVTSWDNTTPGTLNVFELSFDSPTDIDTLQAANFTLATLTFSALSGGISPLSIAINALGDANGDPLAATTMSGSVTVTAVPIPAAIWLFGSGLLGLIGMARRKAA